jgi:hypothetical protein
MALVRCPRHKIPYNDQNPRGCPACARERETGRASEVNAMAELARASQMRRPGTLAAPVVEPDSPVTQQPRFPVPRFSRAMQLLAAVRQRRVLAASVGLVVVLAVVLVASSGPEFTSAVSPAVYTGTVRPLPAEPGQPIGLVFAALGPQSAEPNPTSQGLERYSYGTDIAIDAQNGLIYAITLAVPNRSWRGLQVGMNQTSAEGTLALLGIPTVSMPAAPAAPDTVGGYVTYRSSDQRPRRTLITEVRPPNGCFDVTVDIQPRAIGVVRTGSVSLAAVSRPGVEPDWVVTRIRVVSRAMAGPYATGVAC